MSIPRRNLFGKLGLSLFRAIESATSFAKLRGNPYVEILHWLHQLWQVPNNDLHRMVAHYRLDETQLDRDMINALGLLPSGASSLNDFSHHVETAIERAWILASLSAGDSRVRGAWLLAALVQTPELRRLLLGMSAEFQKVPVVGLLDELPAVIHGSTEDNEAAYDGSDLRPAVPGEASGALASDDSQKSALAKYCTDLTMDARSGRIDPVIGRENEIRTMIDILLRRRQNNPLLTGEAGVGKTAVVEGLALAIASGDVPPALSEVRLLALDVGALVAGASMRGEFESRLKKVLQEAGDSPQPIILFVDEVHTLVGAGGQAGTGDAANLLKPALARGVLRTIGATTWSEYKRHIEKDPALTRRFQVLQVLEPEEAQAVAMVRGMAPIFAGHHDVIVLDEAVRAAVSLSHRYLPSRQLPDKAISLLDTACARVAMSFATPPAKVQHISQQRSALSDEAVMIRNEVAIGRRDENHLQQIHDRIKIVGEEYEAEYNHWQTELGLAQRVREAWRAILEQEEAAGKDAASRSEARQLAQALFRHQGDTPRVHPQVDESIVAAIISDWTGIPVGRMVQDEVAAVLKLREQLEQRVVGQTAALAQIVERVKTSRARLSDPGKPVGVFLLVGPSGVGKTETALALAQTVYGGEQNLITINMSEYQESHTVSSLKGSPPGYVGYGEGGVLTEAVRRRPYSVILLDEIEKAHPDVHEVFYQVFDKGWMEDGEGRVINFKNTLIILTSNVGSERINQLSEDPALTPDIQTLADLLLPELHKVFPVAFLGRVTVVPYLPLPEEMLSQIARLQLARVAARMLEQQGVQLTWSEHTVIHIVEQCGAHETGARRIGRYIEQKILPMLAELWLQSIQEKLSISRISIGSVAEGESHSNALRSFFSSGLRCEVLGASNGDAN